MHNAAPPAPPTPHDATPPPSPQVVYVQKKSSVSKIIAMTVVGGFVAVFMISVLAIAALRVLGTTVESEFSEIEMPQAFDDFEPVEPVTTPVDDTADAATFGDVMEPDDAPVALAETALGAPADAVKFADPGGIYTVHIAPGWDPAPLDEGIAHGIPGDIEFVFLPEFSDFTFGGNVNFGGAEVPSWASLPALFEGELELLNASGMTVTSSSHEIRELDGRTLLFGTMEYTLVDGKPIGAFMVISLEDSQAAAATLTTPIEFTADAVLQYQPYLQTIVSTP